MVRIDSKLDDILTSVLRRLIANVADANESNCYLSMDEDALPLDWAADFVYAVCPTGGEFDQQLMDGGGASQATSDDQLVVRVFSMTTLDQSRRDNLFLTHSTAGVIERMRQVVKALAMYDAEQVGDTEDTLLRNPLLPIRYSFGRGDGERIVGYGAIAFGYSHDWDLTT